MTLQARHIDGKDVQVGHLWRLAPCSSRVHRIVRLDPHHGIAKVLPGRTARIAHCDTGTSITVIDGSPFEVVEEGGVQ